MNKDQLLAVLYDLSLTIGREVTVDALLTKVVQRLLYHTGCPTGLVLGHPLGLDAGHGRVLKVIGDHLLQQQQGEDIALPPGLLGRTIRSDLPQALLQDFTGQPRYQCGLRLPLDPQHTILLLAPTPLLQQLPLEHVFPPVLANLSRAIKLCQDSEQLAETMQRERNQAKAALNRALRFNQALLKAIPIAVFYKDAQGRYLGCNPAFSRTVGMQAEDIIGKLPAEVWPAELAAMFAQKDSELITTRQPQLFEYMISSQQGKLMDVVYAKDLFYDDDNQIGGIIGAFIDISARKQAEESLRQSLIQAISALSSAMVHRDLSTAGHEVRVSDLAVAIGRQLQLGAEQLEGLGLAAMVHDIGQIQIPSEILTRPRRLNHEEFELVKMHAEAGHEILKDIHFPWPIADIAWQHHENMDGSGYPRGLAGSDILLEARIIHVADSMEAMLSHRPFRRQLGLEQAIAQLQQHRGSIYDPDVVDACLSLFLEQGYQLPDSKRKN
ncbi:HD domain-containing phosphohydrolase [Aquitalea magnusonii]|uniref:PAS domain S-box-containing protein n=1 Tax=Aquitalea magnusonii TaxID=332411 RepID=A0A318JRH4_9NEIS|nr:HD-GYP domain-containing protein [Aquitalea magnusonii]PXX51257.1 PAS domain S-box-containing protein [Aquitalea magnusonii]